MGAPTETGVRPGQRLRRWFADLQFHQMWQLAVVAVLALTALFGGLDTVNTKVTDFQPGEEFNDRASLVRELRVGDTQLLAKPGRRYLGVVVDVRNDGTLPGKLTGELDLRGENDTQFLGASRMADGTRLGLLGPGLSDQIAFLWELPEGAVKTGESVTIRVWKKQFRDFQTSYSKEWTYSATDYGQIIVPVKVAP
jgi:hypothetical protein